MATYLEDYLDSVITLPSEIRRNFELMRELDEGAHVLTEEVEQMQKEHLVEAREKVQQRYHESTSAPTGNRGTKPPPDEQELLQLVEENDEVLLSLKTKRQKVFQKMDEKIAIAAQTYDLVDYHIRRLDEDLVRFKSQLQHAQLLEDEEDELLNDMTSEIDPRVSSVESNILLDPFESNPSSQVSENGFFPTSTPNGQSRKKAFENTSVLADTVSVVPVTEDLPIDPNEPLYCKCRRVSYGQMVGCDNDDCKYEWFHYDCVGLKSPPQGKWYCQDCIDIGFGN